MIDSHRAIRRVLAALLLLLGASLLAQPLQPKLSPGLNWRLIGPFRGGRAVAVSGVPGHPDTYYFGSVSGGLWKSMNSGLTWDPIFDGQNVASVGAIAVAPSDPNVIYVGTGEADIRSSTSIGGGVFKSTDAGNTWQFLGLTETRQIGRIVVNAHDPNIVLVAALGHAWGPNSERGIFRSTDGGRNWQKVLYKDENTGAISLAADPADPQTVYAALWNAHRPPWSTYAALNGPGSGIYKSTDGGATWKQIVSKDLPSGDLGRIGLATGRGDGFTRLYALIEHKDGGLFRSDDGGASWTHVSSDSHIRGRAWYFSELTVDPKNPDVVYAPNVALYRSVDGGKTFAPFKGAPGGDDYHSLWVNPEEPRRMIVGCDQGATVSVDGGRTWGSWDNQPTAQFYHVITDNQFPYYVYGAQQDSGTAAVVSRSDYGRITFRDWFSVGAGESGYIAPSPSDPNIVIGGDTYGTLWRFDKRTGQFQDISPNPVANFSQEPSQRPFRFTWTSPLVFSPQDPHTLYYGAQFVLKTTDEGLHWAKISPDLTGALPNANAKGPEPPAMPAGAEANRAAMERGYGAVYTIAPSPVQAGLIWVGSDTGLIHITRDDGNTWQNVTPPGLAPYSKISIIDASHYDAGTAYVAVDRHRLEDYAPYIYRTHDFGKTWQRINDGIAAPAYVHSVRSDTVRKELLYAGTEMGVYYSLDEGDHWQPLQLNLPITPVHDLTVHENDLVAATFGRSFWILDDVTALRQMTSKAVGEPTLFQPPTAIRIRLQVNHDTPLTKETPAGQNAPTGAYISYYLPEAPRGDVTLEFVEDATDKVIRRVSSSDKAAYPVLPMPFTSDWIRPEAPPTKEPGLNRYIWDLRYPRPETVVAAYGVSAAYGVETPAWPQGRLVVPGSYHVRMTVDGRTYTAPLDVKMDPRVTTSSAELKQLFDIEATITNALAQSAEQLKQTSGLRSQIKSAREKAASRPNLVAALDGLDKKLAVIESDGNPSLTSVSRALGTLMMSVDWADRPPTSQAEAALQEQQANLTTLSKLWTQLQSSELRQLNELLKKSGLAELKVTSAGTELQVEPED